jgi:hypothetical protein
MTSRKSRLRRDSQWPAVVDHLLGSSPVDQRAAREILWSEVQRYVDGARLPIGPLACNVDVRRDVWLKVLQRLETDNYERIRHWRVRRHVRPAGSTWWGWIRTIVVRASIDYARDSEENIAPRRQNFRWVRPRLTAPGEAIRLRDQQLSRGRNLSDRSSLEEIIDYITELQARARGRGTQRTDTSEPTDGPPPPPKPRRSKRRR